MSTNLVLQIFENYQKARTQFVQTIAELSKRKENFEDIVSAGGLLLLRPLIMDVVPSIAQTACIALGRMAGESAEIADQVISLEFLPQIVHSISEQNRVFKKCAAYVLRSVSKHSEAHASAVVENEGLHALNLALNEYDPSVKEASCWALSYIAKHSKHLAVQVVECVTLKKLTECLQEPEVPLKRIAANALTQIARHEDKLARDVAARELNVLPYACQLLNSPDPLLRKQVLGLLATLAGAKKDLSEKVMDNLQLDKLLAMLKDKDVGARLSAVELVRNLIKHSSDSARLIYNGGGGRSLLEFLQDNSDSFKEEVVETLETIANFDESLALGLISLKGVEIVSQLAMNSPNLVLKRKCILCLGAMTQHSADHSKIITGSAFFPALVRLLKEKRSAEFTQDLTKGLTLILKSSRDLKAMENLLIDREVPSALLIVVCHRIASTLRKDVSAKKAFAKQNGLKTIQDLKKEKRELDPVFFSALDEICNVYPNDLLRLYDSDYPMTQLKKIDEKSVFEK